MSGEPRGYFAICASDCHFLTLEKAHFKETIEQLEIDRHQKLQDFFRSIPLFQEWTKGKLSKFALCLKFKEFQTVGQIIIKEGTPSDNVYLVK